MEGRPETSADLLKSRLGPDHPESISATCGLAGAYLGTGRAREAVALLEDCRGRVKRAIGPDHRLVTWLLNALASGYLDTDQAGKAEPVFAELVAEHRRREGAGTERFAAELFFVSIPLSSAGRHAAAEPYLRECLAIHQTLRPQSRDTFITQAELGSCLLAQGKTTEAEPVLLTGYAGLLGSEKLVKESVRLFRGGGEWLPLAADRLVELYEKLGKPDEVKRWRAERAKYPFVAPPPRSANRP